MSDPASVPRPAKEEKMSEPDRDSVTGELLVYRCPEEWERPANGLCRPHRCDKDEGHEGKHECDCGRTHR
jgi:hypothetical protein